jgi:hypothetical protein
MFCSLAKENEWFEEAKQVLHNNVGYTFYVSDVEVNMKAKMRS